MQVGTQVSGTIQALYADFNSLVKKGQVLARLDPSLFQTQIEQARANLIRAQADLDRLKVSLEDARTKLARAQELSGRQLIPQSDLETAQVNVRSIDAQIRSSEAQVTQARASLNQNEVNLQHTVISAPIDGLVISRNVDVGQTVAASMSAPTLFILAADLTKMQVVANLDESDVGRIRPGQHVTFRVDAYPADDFDGTVSQVRLQPIVQQNVVTYATVIDVPNPALKLKPGMTANVNIEIAKRTNVLRIPNAGLRFRPTNEIFAALGQTPPDPAQLRAAIGPARARAEVSGAALGSGSAGRWRGSAGRSRSDGRLRAAAGFAAPRDATRRSGRGQLRLRARAAMPRTNGATGAGRRGGGGGRGGGGRGLAERLQGMSPEERERMLRTDARRAASIRRRSSAERIRRAAGRGQRAGTRARRGGRRSARRARNTSSPAVAPPAATTFDALFAPLPPVETAGRVWLYVDNQLKPVRVRVGVSDGQNSELIEGDLRKAPKSSPTSSPAPRHGRRGGAGGFPGLGQPQRGGFPAAAGQSRRRRPLTAD